MKKIVFLMILFAAGVSCGDDKGTRMGVYSGWYRYPHTSYYPYYPFGQYANPWHYPCYGARNSFLYPYSYPRGTGWYDYNGYFDYYYPYAGICFQNSTLMIDLPSIDFFDVSEITTAGMQSQPGAAPITLRSEDRDSIQDLRIDRFLSSGNETNVTQQSVK